MPAQRPHIVVLDTETTGLDPARDRILDLGAVRLDAGLEVVDRYSTLVDPGVPVPLYVTRLTGITDAHVQGAPPFAEAYAALRAFTGHAVLAAHNAGFDREHLTASAARAGLPPPANAWFDTLEAATLLFPELDRHALSLLAEHLGIERTTHRALPDAEATAAVLKHLAARAAGLGGEERRLLTAAGWEPLELLDALGVAPDQAPPPVVPTEPRGGPLPILPVDAQDWRTEFGAPEGGWEADGAAGGGEDGAGHHDARPQAEAPGGAPGLAGRLPGFRHRPGQVRLAEAAADVLSGGGIGLFEAGTGMGKSLAYLLPAAYHTAASGRRVVVSTKTKALQRQLAAHELPLVAGTLPDGWRWALLMGRENYLCRRRLDEAVAAEAEALPDRDRSLALAYLLGRARRGDVDLSALPYRASRELRALPALGRETRSSRAACLGRHCPTRRGCHWRLARERAEAAHLVCVNHALLLTGRDALPAFEDAVIDEAHLLYHEATEAFSDAVDAASLEMLVADLGGRRRQRPLATRLRAAARRAERPDVAALTAAADACERAAGAVPPLVRALGEALGDLAEVARDTGTEAGAADGPHAEGERRAAGGTSDYNLTVWLTAGLREHEAWDRFTTAAGLLSEALAALASGLGPAVEALPEDHRERAPLATTAEEASQHAGLLGELTEPGDPGSVVWGEIESPRRAATRGPSAFHGTPAAPRWTLRRTPLTPARHVRESLWDRLRSAVLTSATLTVTGSFDYYREMTGLDAGLEVREEVFASPFDFRRQAVLILERDPVTAWRPDDLAARHGERLKALADVTGGRTLALFTNTRDMHRVAAAVGAHVEDDGVLVLAQGLHGSAAALAEEFRSHPATVLLGVDTLWTGQDFPGDTLTCLVIAKLPFPRQDPLFHARRLAAEQEGEHWFRRFYLPEAVLKFRQGFGRLIRTETDTGVVVVLDHRLAKQSYRHDFLASLPDVDVVEAPPDAVAAAVEHHLRRLRRA